MSYYDHATYMVFKLDRWSEEQKLKNYQLEAQASKERHSAASRKKQSTRQGRAFSLRSLFSRA